MGSSKVALHRKGFSLVAGENVAKYQAGKANDGRGIPFMNLTR
jgi:hypothetical protein